MTQACSDSTDNNYVMQIKYEAVLKPRDILVLVNTEYLM